MTTDIYLRLSQDRSGEELGITRQRKRAHQLLAARGWTLGIEHVDNDLSASDPAKARAGFEAMMRRVEAGQVKVIIAWDLARLLRNRFDQLRLFEAAEKFEMIISLVEGSDMDMSTQAGQIVADILAGQARAEIKQKSKRQREQTEQAALDGKPPSGPVGFGFLPDRVTHHPEQADAIRDGYTELLGGGTLAGIARQWNAAGVLSGRVRTGRVDAGKASPWRAASVRAILLNPRNAGLRAHRGEVVAPGTWDAIVPEETWLAAVGLLGDDSRKQQAPTPRHLLSGIAVCATCKQPVTAGSANAVGKGRRFNYRCSAPGNGHVARRGDEADEKVEDYVVARLSREDAVKLLATPKGPSPVPALRAERATLGKRLIQVADDQAADLITRAQLLEMTAKFRARRTEIAAEIAEAGRVDALAEIVGAEDVQAVWDSYSPERKRPIVDTLMVVVLHPLGRGARTYNPDSIEIIPKR